MKKAKSDTDRTRDRQHSSSTKTINEVNRIHTITMGKSSNTRKAGSKGRANSSSKGKLYL